LVVRIIANTYGLERPDDQAGEGYRGIYSFFRNIVRKSFPSFYDNLYLTEITVLALQLSFDSSI